MESNDQVKQLSIRQRLQKMIKEDRMNSEREVQLRKMQNEIINEIKRQMEHLDNMQTHFNNTFTLYKRVLEKRLACIEDDYRK